MSLYVIAGSKDLSCLLVRYEYQFSKDAIMASETKITS